MASAAPAPTSTKQDIIASLFSKRAAEDGALEESYISHVKIFEDEGGEGGVKARYLLLAGASPSHIRRTAGSRRAAIPCRSFGIQGRRN